MHLNKKIRKDENSSESRERTAMDVEDYPLAVLVMIRWFLLACLVSLPFGLQLAPQSSSDDPLPGQLPLSIFEGIPLLKDAS